jgi:peptide-methionine (S)-S-oxide reductase
VIRTRVGYTGGSKADPTYTSLGDHTETTEIDFDPAVTTYAAMLKVFWAAHDPTVKCGYKQYEPVVFYQDKAQKALAEQTRAAEAKRRGVQIHTAIRPASTFYLAEDYHQKYYLTLDAVLIQEIKRHYPGVKEMIRSTAAARLNGYVAGYGDQAAMEKEIDALGLTTAGKNRLRALVGAKKK